MDLLQTLILTTDSAVRLSVPLLFACLAGLYSERSGVVDIGLEGKMLGGAFAAGCVAAVTGSAWLGLFAAILVSIGFCSGAWLCLHHPEGQPDRLRCGHQLCCQRSDGSAWAGLVQSWWQDPAIAKHGALHRDQTALCRCRARCAGYRPDLL